MSEHWLVERIRGAAATQAAVLGVHAEFGVRALSARPGRTEFGQAMGPWLLDGHGRLCPGAFLIAADAALGSAIATSLPPGASVMSLSLHAQFITLDPGHSEDFTVCAEAGEVSDVSGLSHGSIVDDHGRTIARLWTHCGFVQGIPAARDPLAVPAHDAWPGSAELDGALLAPISRHRADAHIVDGPGDELIVTAVSAPSLRNSRGELQGGVLGMLAEQAITACLVRDAPGMAAAATMELDVTFLRPVREQDSALRITARTDHAGRRFAAAHADVRDGAGRLVATASGSRYRP